MRHSFSENLFEFVLSNECLIAKPKLMRDVQLKENVKRLGFNVSSALTTKFVFLLDNVSEVSDFAVLVRQMGGAFAEVHIIHWRDLALTVS